MRPQKQHIIFFNNNSKDFNLDTNNKFNNSWLKKLQSRRSPPAAHLQQPKGQYHKNNICHNSRDVYNNHNSKPNNTNTNTHSSPNERVHGPALWVRRFVLRSRRKCSPDFCHCSWAVPHPKVCQPGLVFNTDIGVCDWPWDTPNCDAI